MKILYVLLPLSPFFLKSDAAARSVDVHRRAGSRWHLIQDLTNIAGDLDGTFFIHQNKGMFQKFFILWPFGFILCKAQVDEVDEARGELAFFGVAQLRRVPFHDLRELIEHTVPLRVRKPACG